MDDSMNTLFPEVEYRLVTGETITISPVKFGKLNKFNLVIPRLIDKLKKAGFGASDMELNISGVAGAAFEEIKTIMSIILDMTMPGIDDLTLEDVAGILDIIIQQNVTSRFKKNTGQLMTTIVSLMQELSSTLSPPAIDSQT